MIHRDKGFSLVELIVAVAIASIMGLAIASYMMLGTTTWARATAQNETQQTARLVVKFLSDEIRKSPRVTSPEAKDFTGPITDITLLIDDGLADETTSNPKNDPYSEDDTHRVNCISYRYYVESDTVRGDGFVVLMRDILRGTNLQTRERVAEGLTSLTFAPAQTGAGFQYVLIRAESGASAGTSNLVKTEYTATVWRRNNDTDDAGF